MKERQAHWRGRMTNQIGPQIAYLEAIRDELPEDGILVDEVTQMGFAARLALPGLQTAHVSLAGLSGQSRLGLCDCAWRGGMRRRDVPVVAISGDGGFTVHRQRNGDGGAPSHPAHGDRVRRRRVRQRAPHPGGTVRQSRHRQRPRTIRTSSDLPKVSAPPPSAPAIRKNCARRSRRAIARRDGPTLIEVPVGPLPSPWEFIMMPRKPGHITMARPELAATLGSTEPRERSGCADPHDRRTRSRLRALCHASRS